MEEKHANIGETASRPDKRANPLPPFEDSLVRQAPDGVTEGHGRDPQFGGQISNPGELRSWRVCPGFDYPQQFLLGGDMLWQFSLHQ
jgi:hypothetical protein